MTIQQTSFCSFRLKFKNGEVMINPTGKSREGIVIFSLLNSPYLKYEVEQEVKLVADSAGEFEVDDVFIFGEKLDKQDTFVYRICGENITIGVIGFTNQLDGLPDDFFQDMDILLLASGGGAQFTPKQAEVVFQRFSPKICILFGFSDQVNSKDRVDLLSLEEAKSEIEGMKAFEEKSFKCAKEDLDHIENTELYYFTNI